MSMPVVFLILTALTTGLTLYLTRTTSSEKNVKKRVSDIALRIGQNEHTQGPAIELSVAKESRLSMLVGGILERNSLGEHLEVVILYSGMKMTVGRVALLCGFLSVATLFLVEKFFGMLWVAGVAGVAAATLPYFFLKFQGGRRLGKFEEALPDAIDLMSRALRAGHSMASSIEVLAQQSAEPLAGEFAHCFQQQKFGIPYRDAMLEMASRIPSEDLHFVVTAILVQKETGGDLTEILDRTTRLIRERIKLKGEIKTHTASGRMTGMLLAAMPIVLMVILNLLSPGYSDLLFHDSIGQKLLIASGVMIFIGAMVIRKIVDIKV